jgi:uncharacterized membrane protein YeaQ/YmgE (transglycosylase-associated protein family)
MPFVGFLVFGVLVGGVGRMLVAGKAGGWAVSLMSGAAGSALGGLFGGAGTFHSDPDSAAFSMSLLGAFALTAVYHAVAASRRGRGRYAREISSPSHGP